MDNFLFVKHFKPDSTVDRWGDPSKIDGVLLQKVDAFREMLGLPVYVTSGYREGGPKEHGRGLALDVVVPQFTGHLLDLFFAASRFHFNGIGLYRDWKWNGIACGGLHLDNRNAAFEARWACYKDDAGVQIYTALDVATLRGLKII